MSENNEFVFYSPGNFEEFSFTEISHYITKPGGYKGMTGKLTNEGGRITITTSRDGSPEVVQWFKKEAGGGIPLDLPTKLSFAVKGILKVKVRNVVVTFENLIVAQGHSGPKHPWYVGGSLFTTVGSNGVLYGHGKALSGLPVDAPFWCEDVSLAMYRLYNTETHKFGTSPSFGNFCFREGIHLEAEA